MAKRLDKLGIVSLNIVRPYHVSQSVDAFTGEVAYDINVSGSFQVTGSTILSGSTYIKTLTDTAQTNLLTINPATGQLFYTASAAVGTTTNTGSLLVTASYSSPNLVFTKGNGDTFNVPIAATIDTSSFFKQDGNSFGTTAILGTNDNQPLQFETNGTTKMYIDTNGDVGIGTNDPEYKFHVYAGAEKTYMMYNTSSADGGILLVSDTKNLTRIGVSTPTGSSAAQLLIGVRSSNSNDNPYGRYGQKDDTLIQSTALSNGLNIVNYALQTGNIKENYIRFYAGKPTETSLNNLPDIHIQGVGDNRGYVGINRIDPRANLHISGSLISGKGTIASGSHQTVVGSFNKHGDETSRFIVGGGVDDSTRKDAFIVTSNNNVGINTSTPDGKLTVVGTSGSLTYESGSNPYTNNFLLLSGSANNLTRIDVSTQVDASSNIGTLSYGVRGYNNPGFDGYGNVGDAFIYASSDAYGFNLISQYADGKPSYIRLYAGQNATGGTPDIHIQGSGSNRGYVGINKSNPQTQLHVDGTLTIDPLTSAPSSPGVEGEMVPVNISGTCYLYVFIGGTWKKTQLT
jgi:hypothetical protein